jgi:starch synthase
MSDKLKIFYVASEISPFIRVSELSEVAGSLPKYLKNKGHDVRLMMPKYRGINERKYVLRDVIRLQGLKIKLRGEEFSANGKSAFLPNSKVQVYFLDNREFFDREDVFAAPISGEADAERFLFFGIGCLETLKLLYWQPDIIHCNDWQTAFIPMLLKTLYAKDDFFLNTRTLLSINSPANSAKINKELLKTAGIDIPELKDERFNIQDLGLKYADMVSTISQANSKVLAGASANGVPVVLPGLDKQVWNPGEDDLLAVTYTDEDLSGKYKNKTELLNAMELTGSETDFVLGVVAGSLANETGSVLMESIPKLLEAGARVALLAPNSVESKSLDALRKSKPERFGFHLGYDEKILHLLKAGCDVLLHLDSAEGGIVNQMQSLCYGTLPIALGKETFNSDTGDHAFVIKEFSTGELLKTVKTALKRFEDSGNWQGVVASAMNHDYSWEKSTNDYVALYQKLKN